MKFYFGKLLIIGKIDFVDEQSLILVGNKEDFICVNYIIG